jgi:DNA-directed RNA polymerase subunit N (RpoN/RPB10)
MASPAPVPCQSCGAPADDLEAVRRVYVTPAAWDQEEKVDVVDDVERWCFPCRSMYPHQPA